MDAFGEKGLAVLACEFLSKAPPNAELDDSWKSLSCLFMWDILTNKVAMSIQTKHILEIASGKKIDQLDFKISELYVADTGVKILQIHGFYYQSNDVCIRKK